MAEAKKSDLTRKRILDSGRALLLRNRLSGVGPVRIPAEIQAPKGSFYYYYFVSKEAFGTALYADYVESYLERIDVLIAGPGTSGEKLDRFWDAWPAQSGSVGTAGECLVVKLGAEVADLSNNMRDTLDQGVDALCGRIARLLLGGSKHGRVRVFNAPQAAACMLYPKWLGAAVLVKLASNDTGLRRART
ncbi:TetR/AcrR family transcriptional regulator [Sulfitobacter sp.]|uniref:TetR/AcrR family transcriptional regulator n=1 Tax=Sulfitobacter sp. TaxID=1903071 RepID=UPI0030031AAB